MISSNGNGAAANRGMPATSENQPKFDVSAMATFWTSSSARLTRSSEILMRGMTELAWLETKLGQQCLQRAIGTLQTPALGMQPDQLMRTQIDQTLQDVDGLSTTMRKIADQFWHTITGSTQALFDVSGSPSTQSLGTSIDVDDTVVKRKPAPAAAGQSATG